MAQHRPRATTPPWQERSVAAIATSWQKSTTTAVVAAPPIGLHEQWLLRAGSCVAAWLQDIFPQKTWSAANREHPNPNTSHTNELIWRSNDALASILFHSGSS
jgi:hypothetical protein